MTKHRGRSIALGVAGVVAMAAIVRVSHGLLKNAIAAFIVDQWPKIMRGDFQPRIVFIVSFNVLLDALTALPGAVAAVIVARLVLGRRVLPFAVMSALLLGLFDKRFHHVVRNPYNEQYLALLLSAIVAPTVLVVVSYCADILRSQKHFKEQEGA